VNENLELPKLQEVFNVSTLNLICMSQIIVCYGPKHTTIQARICFYAFIGVVLIIDVLYAIIYAQLTHYGFTYKLTLSLKLSSFYNNIISKKCVVRCSMKAKHASNTSRVSCPILTCNILKKKST
jgi:hypothetical protein